MDNKGETCSRQETSAFVKTFMLVFVPIIVALMVFHLSLYQLGKKHALQSLSNIEVHRATLLAATLREHFAWIMSDLNFIAKRQLAASIAVTHPALVKAGIENDLLLFSREKKMYDQIRIINNQGREQLRINYNDGAAYAVSANELQDKSLHSYFKDCLALAPGNIYISPLDLHVERGEVAVPFTPSIRFATPLVDGHGQKTGIIILNYYGTYLLKQVRDELAYPHQDEFLDSASTMLVNAAGYWLVAPDEEDEWGFMFAHRKGRTFAKRYPKEWDQMSGKTSGYLPTTHGFFVFATIPSPVASETDPFGKVISFVSAQRMEHIIYQEKSNFYLLAFLLVALTGAVSLGVALLAARKIRYEQEFARSAVTDSLTGLLNRRAFLQRLEVETGRVDRYGGRLFVILGNIDHFKSINDNHGHDAGDCILKKLATTLTANLRSTDVLCRWSGEEFMALVSGYVPEDGEKVAEKLRQAVEAEVMWFNNPRLKVTMSFGVCSHRKNMSMEELLKCSDEMLATSKRNGRNQVTAERL